MTASRQDQRLTAARERLQRLRQQLRTASDASLLDEALACLTEAAGPPPSLDDPAAADLVEANRQLRALLDNTLVGIYRTTRDGRVL